MRARGQPVGRRAGEPSQGLTAAADGQQQVLRVRDLAARIDGDAPGPV